MIPESFVVKQAVTITIDDVIKRVELQQECSFRSNPVNVPENRRKEKQDAGNYSKDVFNIRKKKKNGRGEPTDSNQQYANCKNEINGLEPEKGRVYMFCKEDQEAKQQYYNMNHKV